MTGFRATTHQILCFAKAKAPAVLRVGASETGALHSWGVRHRFPSKRTRGIKLVPFVAFAVLLLVACNVAVPTTALPTSTLAAAAPTTAPTTASTPLPAPTPLPTGRALMDYPSTLTVGTPAVIALEIKLDRPIASTEPIVESQIQVIDVEQESSSTPYYHFDTALQLYPIMSAELVVPNFTVAKSDSSATPRRTLRETGSAYWTWNITAITPGKQQITINLYGTDTPNEEQPFNMVKSITRYITVLDMPWNERLQNWLGNNVGLLLGTGGPLGLLLAYLVYRANRSKGNR